MPFPEFSNASLDSADSLAAERAVHSVYVRAVAGRADLAAFIRLPYRLYRGDPLWVAPLLTDIKRQLNPAKNPWFDHSEAEFFLARRGRRVVGRISAQIDHTFNEYQQNTWGLFGWFECENDDEAARALFDGAADWLRARGRDRMVGPCSFTTNDECGVLIDGFDIAPGILEPFTPRFYPGLFEAAGFAKAMDLLMWRLDLADRANVHPDIWSASRRVDEDGSFLMKQFSRRSLNDDADRFRDVYNASWEKNWGFVPLSQREMHYYADSLRPIMDRHWSFAMIDRADGSNAGAALTLPDYNQVLRHLHGRLLPLGWLKLLWYRRKIDQVRVLALGVKPKYRTTGLGARMYTEHFTAADRTRVVALTMGWTLESNEAINRGIRGMGGTRFKTWRLYERTL